MPRSRICRGDDRTEADTRYGRWESPDQASGRNHDGHGQGAIQRCRHDVIARCRKSNVFQLAGPAASLGQSTPMCRVERRVALNRIWIHPELDNRTCRDREFAVCWYIVIEELTRGSVSELEVQRDNRRRDRQGPHSGLSGGVRNERQLWKASGARHSRGTDEGSATFNTEHLNSHVRLLQFWVPERAPGESLIRRSTMKATEPRENHGSDPEKCNCCD